MYKVGDEVFVKATVVKVDGVPNIYPYLLSPRDREIKLWMSEEGMIPADKTYEQGLADAWELAKSMVVLPEYGGISNGDLVNMFGTFSPDKIFKGFTVKEALAKIEAYEFMQRIQEGDVVEASNGLKGVVVKILPSGGLNIIHENGLFSADCPDVKYKKTGKHIDIESLLRQIGE